MWSMEAWKRSGLGAVSDAVKTMSSSTLVETVSIPLEDFAESFLTCATCLCPYDADDRRPKLLSCSHTVCGHCLARIAALTAEALPASESASEEAPAAPGSIRCPICREQVRLPSGGVGAFPPSFLVNQLIDLMQRQRKDVVAKCAGHPGEEMLFCETCDNVFCPLCRDAVPETRDCHNHTILPLSVAVKRMSEILAYKAAQCERNLAKASEAVEREMQALDANVDAVLEELDASFQAVSGLVEGRRRAVTEALRRTREAKRRVLQDQLLLVQAERAKVQNEARSANAALEVREITAKISELNGKLDRTLTLMEPRENAFLRHDADSEKALAAVHSALGAFGTLAVSRTFPALCEAEAPSGPVATHTLASVRLTTIDYHGARRSDGGDPVTASLQPADDAAAHLPVTVLDHKNGAYSLQFRVPNPGQYKLHVRIFGRAIKNCPLDIAVSPYHNPVWAFDGGEASELGPLRQPVKVAVAADGLHYVLDTGNSRILVLSESGAVIRALTGASLRDGSAVGMELLPPSDDALLLTLNWRSRAVTEWDRDGQESRSFTFSEFQEPIDVAVDPLTARILVADNAARKVFVFDSGYRPLLSFPVGAAGATVTCLAAGHFSDILVGTSRGLEVFGRDGAWLRQLELRESAGKGSLLVGGLVVDAEESVVLASVSEKGRTRVCVADYDGGLRYCLDSEGARLKRPAGLALSADGAHVLVADLGNHCVKKFRFK